MSEAIFTLKEVSTAEFLNLAGAFSNQDGTLLLFSGTSFLNSQKSYLSLFPVRTVTISNQNVSTWDPSSGWEKKASLTPWEELQHFVGPAGCGEELFPKWMGYCGYELGSYSDPDVRPNLSPTSLPDAYFQQSALNFCYDHPTATLSLQVNSFQMCELQGLKCSGWSLENWHHYLRSLPAPHLSVSSLRCLQPPPTCLEYARKVAQAKELIYAGDCYQINLSHSSLWQCSAPPFHIFLKLNRTNPAPFSGYFKLPFGSFVSSSPERLLLHQSKTLTTSPIKGTAPRSDCQKEDAINLERLITSSKENAELMMITDLMRNDLGKVSVLGSVRVSALREPQAFTNVFHMHSLIASTPEKTRHSIELLRAVFPGGSVTGCPKLKAMEAIQSLEQRPRHLYTGSMGYLKANGEFDFNIAIRTLIFRNEIWEMQVGGAIVTDSIAENEYLETFYKSSSILQALGFNSQPSLPEINFLT